MYSEKKKLAVMHKKPTIGLTGSYSTEIVSFVKSNYVRAVSKAGGVPLMIPPELSSDSVEQLFDLCDGILITGGEDLDPALYGQKPHPKLGKVSPERDEIDKVIVGLCMKKNKPFFAICRGIQSVNVFLGGTLIQDIGECLHSPIQHSQPEHYTELTHEVKGCNGDVLKKIVGSDLIRVNSRHHQCVDKLGKNLEVIGRCTADNIVEAMYVKNHPFGLAVQWHPEWLVNEHAEHLALFKALVNAAKGQLHLNQ